MHLNNIHGFSGFLDNIITKWPLCELESNLAMILPGNSNVSNIRSLSHTFLPELVFEEKRLKSRYNSKTNIRKKKMDFDEDDLGNSQDSQQFRQGYYIHIFLKLNRLLVIRVPR